MHNFGKNHQLRENSQALQILALYFDQTNINILPLSPKPQGSMNSSLYLSKDQRPEKRGRILKN